MRFRIVWLLLVVAVAPGCLRPESPGLAARQHVVDALQKELEKAPEEQDRGRLDSLAAELGRHIEADEATRARQARFIEGLRRRLAHVSPTGEPPLPPGPYVIAIKFSFHTRPRDRDKDGTSEVIDVTVWPKDAADDTVKAVGTMTFVLRRQALFPGAGGKVLQTWFRGPQAVDDAWEGAWVLNGHHFELELDAPAQEAHRVVLDVSYIGPDGREITAKPPKYLKL